MWHRKNSNQSLKCLAIGGIQIKQRNNLLVLFVQNNGHTLTNRRNLSTPYEVAECVKRSMNHLADHSLYDVGKWHKLHHRYPSVLRICPAHHKKRLPGGKVSFPMLQKKVSDRIESGDIRIGQDVVPTACPRYTVQHGELTLESTDVYARKIPLLEIRERLLKQHEELGIVRQNPDEYYATLSEEVVKTKLTELHETIDPILTPEELREKLKSLNHHRLLKVWHDHSEIAGHSHLLVLVAAVYDPAFFFTPQEMQLKGVNIDVPTVVEEPQVHIFGRSSSSLDDQSQFIECRREC